MKSDRHMLVSLVVAGSLCPTSVFDQQALKDPRQLLLTNVNHLQHVRGNRDFSLLVYSLVRNVHADFESDLFTLLLLPSLTHLCLTSSSEDVVPTCLLLSSLRSHLSTHRLHALSRAHVSRITVLASHFLRSHASSPIPFVLGLRVPASDEPLVLPIISPCLLYTSPSPRDA